MKEGNTSLSYEESGVSIDTADRTKKEMSSIVGGGSDRVLNTLGAFGSLIDFKFDDIDDPVLVLKMEEPGSKQLLAAQHGKLSSVGYDLVNHLINDTVVMGARPIAVLDTIICGTLEQDVVVRLVSSMADACEQQGCSLVGGETSEQPRVIPDGSYILSAACAGIVSKRKIVDGSAVKEGDIVLGVASNGVHTNGYTLIRSLLDREPALAEAAVGDETFIDAVLRPHLCYNLPLQEIFRSVPVNGLAHITGGGVVDNTKRILPSIVNAEIDLSSIEVLPLFSKIKEAGNVPEEDMLRTFNLGVGLTAICDPSQKSALEEIFGGHGMNCYQIGEVVSGSGEVVTKNSLSFT